MKIYITEMQKQDLNNINIEEFDDFWNKKILEEDFKSEFSKYVIAKCAETEEVLGFAGINIILDEAHIANIAVKRNKRNLKIGSQLLEELIRIAKEKAKLMTLEVNVNNNIAIHLYEKYGFENKGKRTKYYNNQFDAYIMTKMF